MYKVLFCFELGRSTSARFYAWLPELIIILSGLKYLLNLTLEWWQIAIIIPGFVLIFIVMGYFIHKLGLYNVDQYVKASRDPVQTEILTAARKINNQK